MAEEYIDLKDVPKEQAREKRRQFFHSAGEKLTSFGRGVESAVDKTAHVVSKAKGGLDKGIEKYHKFRQSSAPRVERAVEATKTGFRNTGLSGQRLYSAVGSGLKRYTPRLIDNANRGGNMFLPNAPHYGKKVKIPTTKNTKSYGEYVGKSFFGQASNTSAFHGKNPLGFPSNNQKSNKKHKNRGLLSGNRLF